MTATVDAQMTRTARPAERGFFKTAFQRPVLTVVSALLLFASAVIGSFFYGSTESINAGIEVVRLDLDRDASGPASLVKIAPLSIDAERAALLSDQLINEALETVVTPGGRAPSAPSSGAGGRSVDANALSTAVRKDLRVEAGTRNNVLEISLPFGASEDFGTTDDQSDMVNSIAARYVELRNQERRQQKEQALSWADNKLAYWQGAIDILTFR